MARDILIAELARQRHAELLRRAGLHRARHPAPRSEPPARPHEAVTIRLAAAEDRRELDLLADRHGAGVPAGPRLIAELGGTPVAAMSLSDRAVVADPGRRTSDVVELLRLRAAQLHGDARPRPQPVRLLGSCLRVLTPRRTRNPGPA
ncbi:MAG TPA: hypothetical protein VMF09_12390 [Solirubrobacteraceae bacterium]|nr:hypothetical protein [Solirubrobacteraceae bacterium]